MRPRSFTRALVPRAQVSLLAVERFGQPRLFLCPDEGKDRSARHGYVGVAGQLQHAQCMQRLLVAPGIAGDDGDAENCHVRSLKQRHDRHLIGAARTGAVLIDKHQPVLRLRHEGRERQDEKKSRSSHRWVFRHSEERT